MSTRYQGTINLIKQSAAFTTTRKHWQTIACDLYSRKMGQSGGHIIAALGHKGSHWSKIERPDEQQTIVIPANWAWEIANYYGLEPNQ